MRPTRDPEGEELKHLLGACVLSRRNVLEIGSGDGKFTRQYLGLAGCAIGIDPNIDDLREAYKNKSNSNSHFIQAEGEKLPLPASAIDIALFASSL